MQQKNSWNSTRLEEKGNFLMLRWAGGIISGDQVFHILYNVLMRFCVLIGSSSSKPPDLSRRQGDRTVILVTF